MQQTIEVFLRHRSDVVVWILCDWYYILRQHRTQLADRNEVLTEQLNPVFRNRKWNRLAVLVLLVTLRLEQATKE